ncbi:DUF3955 domain-containing protein [Listeria booriae]|uniref:DUF3955 domain-containing protein n=1 Tax=Listeria booriae TaxID=1552123 RepID=UPI001629AB79|nr:DUF3955 domain-containing protein [Listeria booriae]MBC1359431.1 DUF3955 domain-containing protein [Listeria booriae]
MMKKWSKWFGLILILMGVLCLVIAPFVPVEIDAEGFVHEPGFFLIPVSYVFFLSGIIVTLVMTLRKKLRKQN